MLDIMHKQLTAPPSLHRDSGVSRSRTLYPFLA
jgi:hypothetical protein